MNRLRGKRILITGGTSGIGLATARRFVEEGARVAVTGMHRGRIKATRSVLGQDAIVLEADAADIEGHKLVAGALAEAFGQLDALFVNAAIGDFRPIDEWDEAAFDRSCAVNLKGPFFLIQALLPIFANPASIVLTGSVNARIGTSNSSVYAATKAGLASLAKTLSGELIGRGIRANVISPGPISTAFHRKLGLGADELEAMKADLLRQLPLHRFGEPADIADIAVYFASDESRFVVGSEIVIDGGMSTL
jgi:NAD(P)-dependent dehydrogenase (short-subunit alcohol dehydrogenase family)